MIFICDLESTCWDTKLEQDHEPIRISGCLYCPDTDKVVLEIDEYVKPVRHPILSQFCKDLTGITQEQVDNADIFVVVWERIIGKISQFPNSYTFASWSLFDAFCVDKECRINYGKISRYFCNFINIKQLYRIEFGIPEKKRIGLLTALKNLGLEFEGTQHNSLHDARNTLAVYKLCYKKLGVE